MQHATILHLQPETKADRKVLWAEFDHRLAITSPAIEPLRSVVQRLLAAGVHWKELYARAAKTGRDNKYIRKLLSEFLIEAGIRRRERGAGPNSPQESLLIEAQVRNQHGHLTTKFLRGALRVSIAHDEALAAAAEAQALSQAGISNRWPLTQTGISQVPAS